MGAAAPSRGTARRRGFWRALERLLLVIGLVSLGYFAYVVAESHLYQALENRELDAILASAPRRLALPTPSAPRPACLAPGSMIGRIEIPRLGVSTIIRAGQRRADAATRGRSHPRHRLSRRIGQHRPRGTSRHVLPPPARHPRRRRDPDRDAGRDATRSRCERHQRRQTARHLGTQRHAARQC